MACLSDHRVGKLVMSEKSISRTDLQLDCSSVATEEDISASSKSREQTGSLMYVLNNIELM